MNAPITKVMLLTFALCANMIFTSHAALEDNYSIINKAEGELGVEGEGELIVEGEIKEEGEGEVPVEPGRIARVDLLSPRTGMIIDNTNETVTMLLVAEVQIQEGVLDPSHVTVLFSIEDMAYQAAWHEAGFFFLSVVLSSEPPLREEEGEGEGEGEGEIVEGEEEITDPFYQIKVIAHGDEEDDYVESDLYEIAIRKGDDLDENGFADDPFTALSETSDIWFSLNEGGICARTIAMKSMQWGDGTTSLFVQNPDDPDQVVSVQAPNALVEPEEYGILIVSTACSPEALYSPYEISSMITSAPGPPSEGGMYMDVSIIYSRDQGHTFNEVTPLRLAANPIRVAVNRVKTRDGFQNLFYGYPTIVDSDIAAGIRIVPLTGLWTEDGIADLGAENPDGIHSVDLYRLYAVAPFEMPFPGELSVVPDPTTGYNYGVLKINHPETAIFILTNTGGEVLQCEIELEDEEGVFFVQENGLVSLEPDEKYELKVQFNPAITEEYEATLLFHEGDNAIQKLILTGRGAADAKSIQPLGCGTPAPDKTGAITDILVGMVALTLLYSRSRSIKKRRASLLK